MIDSQTKKINRNANRNTNTNTIKFAEQKNVLLITWIISHIIITTALKKIYIYISYIYIYIKKTTSNNTKAFVHI